MTTPSTANLRRSKRSSKPIERHGAYISHLHATNENNKLDYDEDECKILVIAMHMHETSYMNTKMIILAL